MAERQQGGDRCHVIDVTAIGFHHLVRFNLTSRLFLPCQHCLSKRSQHWEHDACCRLTVVTFSSVVEEIDGCCIIRQQVSRKVWFMKLCVWTTQLCSQDNMFDLETLPPCHHILISQLTSPVMHCAENNKLGWFNVDWMLHSIFKQEYTKESHMLYYNKVIWLWEHTSDFTQKSTFVQN